MGISIMFAHQITHKIIKGSSALELYEKIHCISLFICNKIQQNIEIYIAGHEIIYRQTALSPTDHKIMSNLRIRLVKNRKHEKKNQQQSLLCFIYSDADGGEHGGVPPPPIEFHRALSGQIAKIELPLFFVLCHLSGFGLDCPF